MQRGIELEDERRKQRLLNEREFQRQRELEALLTTNDKLLLENSRTT